MSAIRDVQPLTFPWQPLDPFLFCAHHRDHYPPGDEDQGPAAPLDGRRIGQDFSGRDGWSMYHGERVPGFPRHPHRGFETITILRNGAIDHADSLGAKARFEAGDVQWMTAGQGVEHSEMFPLRAKDADNPLELFQIWLNLPRRSKKVPAYFTMLWDEQVPRHRFEDADGREIEVVTAAGALNGVTPPAPPPDSWAADADNGVAVWTLRLAPGARWTLPAAADGLNRALFFFAGASAQVDGRRIEAHARLTLESNAEVELVADSESGAEFVLLQGRPLGEPVVAHGPFVMNTVGEIRQTMLDYQAGAFGTWPWSSSSPVHPRDAGRFAVHPDGREERPA